MQDLQDADLMWAWSARSEVDDPERSAQQLGSLFDQTPIPDHHECGVEWLVRQQNAQVRTDAGGFASGQR
jgi:hypothetical protein